MSSSTTTAHSSSCFPEKPETCLGDGARDRFAASGSSFDWANDVDCQSYSASNPRDTDEDDYGEDEDLDVSRSDIRASIVSVDRLFASGIRTISESGSSLSAMSEDDEDDGLSFAATDSGSTDVRSLVDRIFAGGPAPSRYNVASVPSLGAIEEEDEFELDDDGAQTGSSNSDSDEPASTTLNTDESEHFDEHTSRNFGSLWFSRTSFPTLDEDEDSPVEDDLNSGWVLVEAGDRIKVVKPQKVPPMRSCEARERRWCRVIRKFFAL